MTKCTATDPVGALPIHLVDQSQNLIFQSDAGKCYLLVAKGSFAEATVAMVDTEVLVRNRAFVPCALIELPKVTERMRLLRFGPVGHRVALVVTPWYPQVRGSLSTVSLYLRTPLDKATSMSVVASGVLTVSQMKILVSSPNCTSASYVTPSPTGIVVVSRTASLRASSKAVAEC